MPDDNSFMAGLPELAILRLLQDREMYGYEIVQAIALRTGAALAPGEGVVYPLLHGLEQSGALKSRRKSVGGRSRVYYTLTAKGARRLSALTARWSELNGEVKALMGAAPHAA
jgi:PadR family transcriptional regulator PadR